MNRQTLQAKESAPAKKSSFSWLRPAAAHPAAEAEHEAPSASSPAFAHDFTKVPVRPMQLPGVPGFSCPFAPQRCPSGGACHACPPKMQAKLKIGQPGDRYEQEADRVAETVMRMPEPQMQRKGCSAPGCKDEDEDKLVQTKSAGSAGNAQVDHPLIQSVLTSPGQPLDAATRSFMEPRFGQDFSGVRVHVGGEAAESARAVNARAYTVGRNVVFGEGQYVPGSGEGRRLMAHELVHVGQQMNHIKRYVMRSPAEPLAQDFGFNNIQVSLATDQEDDSIGHTWIIIHTPDGGEDSYGFWPDKLGIDIAVGGLSNGRVHHPDNAHKPDAIYPAMTDLQGLQKGVDYANRNKNAMYNLFFFNCATFARTMFEVSTGQVAPSGGLLIDSPNELAEKIKKGKIKKFSNQPAPAPGVFPPSPPPPMVDEIRKKNLTR